MSDADERMRDAAARTADKRTAADENMRDAAPEATNKKVNTHNENKDTKMSDADESMRDAPEVIRLKIQNLANSQSIQGSFEVVNLFTKQLRSLRDVCGKLVEAGDDIGSEKLSYYDVDMGGSKVFMNLACKPAGFYERSGYRELYDYIAAKWNSKDEFRVILLGNAGTGKSWFQVYALKRLLDDTGREFDIIIRQVDAKIYVIDLEDASVYRWRVEVSDIGDISTSMKKTLYFFEPGEDATMPPLGVVIPSLSTLSPFAGRIKEYRKRFCTYAYFWPWSFGEMWSVVCHSKISLDLDEFQARYTKFGGILRNVLGEETGADDELTSRLTRVSVDVLTSIALNVDREDAGDNVSGYIVCYDNRLVATKDRFKTKNLEYTSLKVEEEVAKMLAIKPVEDKMIAVLGRLNGVATDVSGKMLESVAMELLSKGSVYAWDSRQVETPDWDQFPFATRQRTIKRTFTLKENFMQDGLIIGPSKSTFPVVDFVLSCPGKKAPVVAFQCTWQSYHPFSVRALCDLRIKHLEVEDDQKIDIYIVCPSTSDALAEAYACRSKEDFLRGSLEVDFQFTKAEKVLSSRLQEMWKSTNIFVLKPSTSWEAHIKNWLATHGRPGVTVA
jgi:hypothetical protein